MIVVLLLLAGCPYIKMCKWPKSDILFILDGSYSVNQYEHEQEISFIRKCLENIRVSEAESRISLAQFTPKARYEWGLADASDNEEIDYRLQQIFYAPCDTFDKKQNCSPIASLNSLARYGLENGNRKWLPDIIVSISNSRYKLPEIGEKEVLMSPISPIHLFHVNINSNDQKAEFFQASATSIQVNAVDFNALDQLVVPLCESVNTFVGQKNSSKFGPLCWTVTAALAGGLLLIFLIACYIIYTYKEQNSKLKHLLYDYEKSIRSQNEFFTAKLHAQMEDHIKTGQKHSEEIRQQQQLLKDAHDELKQHLKEQPLNVNNSAPQPIIIPFYPPGKDKERLEDGKSDDRNNNQSTMKQSLRQRTIDIDKDDNNLQLRFEGNQLEVSNGHISTRLLNDEKHDPSSVTLQLSTKKPQGSLQEELNKEKIRIDHDDPYAGSKSSRNYGGLTNRRPISRLELGESLASRYWKEDPNFISSETEDSILDEVPPRGHLPAEHPARTLPPIDILFLVDSSSSIGITNFDAMKSNITKVLEDVDIQPGRSRVALIQYSQEPSVVFGFEKYYSIENIKKGINRMSYTGGATMLAKALSFAAGVLYKEQNLKESRRKHKLMPTPRHDRLQILCLVSDGASDDSIHKATTYIHEKLQAKVLGIVSKSFNKDKLLPITKFEGSTFVMTQTESISIWLWRQQKIWGENYSTFLEQDKSLSLSIKQNFKKS